MEIFIMLSYLYLIWIYTKKKSKIDLIIIKIKQYNKFLPGCNRFQEYDFLLHDYPCELVQGNLNTLVMLDDSTAYNDNI